MRGFSLAEIMVALVVISLLIVGSYSLTIGFVHEYQWNRVFSKLEDEFLKANTKALAGLSSTKNIPEQYALYFETGTQEMKMWYLELSSKEILFQFPVFDDSIPIQLQKIAVLDKTAPAALLIFTPPFAQLNFYLLSAALPKDSEFVMKPNIEISQTPACSSDTCALELTFVRPGTSNQRTVLIDLQKGIERL